jgi:hypothetical protein
VIWPILVSLSTVILDCDLASSSTRTGQSLSSDTSRQEMCYFVNRSKKEGQSPGLMEVDAVCRVLLLEVEQASSKQL